MKILSRTILYIECLLLVYPSIFGFLFSMGGMLQLFSGLTLIEKIMGFLTGLLLLVTLTSGWRVIFWVIFGGPGRRDRIDKSWFLFCYLGAGLTVAAWIYVWLKSTKVISSLGENTLELFVYGVFFIIPFIHTMFEKRRQERANNGN